MLHLLKHLVLVLISSLFFKTALQSWFSILKQPSLFFWNIVVFNLGFNAFEFHQGFGLRPIWIHWALRLAVVVVLCFIFIFRLWLRIVLSLCIIRGFFNILSLLVSKLRNFGWCILLRKHINEKVSESGLAVFHFKWWLRLRAWVLHWLDFLHAYIVRFLIISWHLKRANFL